jgi:hypothetical protein
MKILKKKKLNGRFSLFGWENIIGIGVKWHKMYCSTNTQQINVHYQWLRLLNLKSPFS